MQRVLSFPSAQTSGDSSEVVSKRLCFSFMFSIGFLALLSGFLLGRFAFDQELILARNVIRQSSPQQRSSQNPIKTDNSSNFEDLAFRKPLSEDSIQNIHRSLIEASKDSANKTLAVAVFIRQYLEEAGFQLISPLKPTYTQLAFPDKERPNQVTIFEEDGKEFFSCPDVREHYLVTGNTNATRKSASSKVQPVYVNFGRDEDYLYLDSIGINVADSVVLARAGGLPVRELLAVALDHDAQAVLLYLDPAQQDVAPELISPEELAQIQILENEAAPILVISQNSAEIILKNMSPKEPSPSSWRGGLPCSYSLGPGFHQPEWSMQVSVNTVSITRVSYSIVTGLKGAQEPDRMVVIGNNLKEDAAINFSDSAVLMEVARELSALNRTGWKPHRSIVIGFWGANSDSEVIKSLSPEVVTYLDFNLELGRNSEIIGSTVLVPMFRKIASSLDVDGNLNTLLPPGNINDLGRMGLPFLQYQHNGADTNISEISYQNLSKLGAVWGRIAVKIATERLIPFSLDPYVLFFNHTLDILNQRFEVVARRHKLFLETLTTSVNELTSRINKFEKNLLGIEESNSITLRRVNDQIIEFSRALACPRAAVTSPQRSAIILTRHLLFSRSFTGNDLTSGLGELQDLLREMTSTTAPDDLQKQIVTLLTDAMKCLKNATIALSDRLSNIIINT